MAKKLPNYVTLGFQMIFMFVIFLLIYSEYLRWFSHVDLKTSSNEARGFIDILMRDFTCKQEHGIDYIFDDASESCKKCDEVCSVPIFDHQKLSVACVSRCRDHLSMKKMIAEVDETLAQFRNQIKADIKVPPPTEHDDQKEHVLNKLKEIDEHSAKLQGLAELDKRIEGAAKLIQDETNSIEDEIEELRGSFEETVGKLQHKMNGIEAHEYVFIIGLLIACIVVALLLMLLYFGLPCYMFNRDNQSKTKEV